MFHSEFCSECSAACFVFVEIDVGVIIRRWIDKCQCDDVGDIVIKERNFRLQVIRPDLIAGGECEVEVV